MRDQSEPSRADGVRYVPVSCSFHDRLEDAAVRRLTCRINYRTPEGEERNVRTTIDDVWSKQGEEFVRLGTGDVVRLDRLEGFEPLPRDGAEDGSLGASPGHNG